MTVHGFPLTQLLYSNRTHIFKKIFIVSFFPNVLEFPQGDIQVVEMHNHSLATTVFATNYLNKAFSIATVFRPLLAY